MCVWKVFIHNHTPEKRASLAETAVGTALFFTPGACLALYALYRGKGNFSDGFSRVLTELSQGYFNPNAGGENVPVCEGELSDLAGGDPLFVPLQRWAKELGGVYKLAFGPKCFLVISDPTVARHVLRENAFGFDKGMLGEILSEIMGKGLIPADNETWKPRRRAVVPAFHKAYLVNCVDMFGACAEQSIKNLDSAAESGKAVDLENEYLNLALDIIGIGVFNYDFGSVTTNTPVVKAVYGALKEAEHRSTFYLPYWNVPLLRAIVPRQRKFAADMKVINDTLDELITTARNTTNKTDMEALQNRDYSKVQDASLLRFLVDMRGEDIEDATDGQLRDDLMTMLIAGHETTAQVLTWASFCLSQDPELEARVAAEVDEVIGDRRPTLEDIRRMPLVRLCVAESLRLYPQPPLLIRQSVAADTLPGGIAAADPSGYPIGPKTDLFISVYNIHRDVRLWGEDADKFRPERFYEARKGSADGTWEGMQAYDPEGGPLYPNEVGTNFAYIPFGGGPRKCIGDQFAMTEATVVLAMFLRRYKFALDKPAEEVGMATGATIHTASGLPMRVTRRAGVPVVTA